MSMTNEEKYLKERVGQENPFRTPEGYFDQFTANIMAQLPDKAPRVDAESQQPVAKKVAMPFRHWFYAAACVAALVVTAVTFHFHEVDAPQQQMAVSESYIDEAADYAMLDNMDIYQLLAEE